MKNRETFGPARRAVASIGAGASSMYFLDWQLGARRRRQVQDRLVHGIHTLNSGLGKSSKDLANRSKGLFSQVRSFFYTKQPDDAVLVERVRSKLGRYVSHPHVIEVGCQDGTVTLSGPILSDEADPLIQRISKMFGVKEIQNQLELHTPDEHIQMLQGGSRRPGEHFNLFEGTWAPATRVTMSGIGLWMILSGMRRKGVSGGVLTLIGSFTCARSFFNRPLRQILGFGPGPMPITVRKTVHLSMPVAQAYQFWSSYENLPQFMHQVKKVKVYGNNRSQWTIQGPFGIPISWDACTTAEIPNQLIAWKSVPGSVVQNTGKIRFQPNERQGTRVDIEFAYNPPLGILGHYFFKLFALDPKRRMDLAMVELKGRLERPSANQITQIKAA